MLTAVLDEHAAGHVAGQHSAAHEQAGHHGLEGRRVMLGHVAARVTGYPELAQQGNRGAVADLEQHGVVG